MATARLLGLLQQARPASLLTAGLGTNFEALQVACGQLQLSCHYQTTRAGSSSYAGNGRRVAATAATLQAHPLPFSFSRSRTSSNSSHEVINSSSAAAESLYALPNLVSVARAASAPFIAGLIIMEHWDVALVATALSGLSDWADGALARRLNQTSVLGSYLDPLADKILVGCVVGALAAKGLAPAWVASLIIGRDVGLVAGMTIHRWRMLGWRTRGMTAAEFFRTTAPAASSKASSEGTTISMGSSAESVPFMRPLLISKANTVLQLLLVGSFMSHAAFGTPGQDLLWGLEVTTAGTTAASLVAYAWLYASGRMLALRTAPNPTCRRGA